MLHIPHLKEWILKRAFVLLLILFLYAYSNHNAVLACFFSVHLFFYEANPFKMWLHFFRSLIRIHFRLWIRVLDALKTFARNTLIILWFLFVFVLSISESRGTDLWSNTLFIVWAREIFFFTLKSLIPI